MRKLTAKQRKKAAELIPLVATLQHEFWDALAELERLTGMELSSIEPYDGMTVEKLRGIR